MLACARHYLLSLPAFQTVSSACRNLRKKSGLMWQDHIYAAAATYTSCSVSSRRQERRFAYSTFLMGEQSQLMLQYLSRTLACNSISHSMVICSSAPVPVQSSSHRQVYLCRYLKQRQALGLEPEPATWECSKPRCACGGMAAAPKSASCSIDAVEFCSEQVTWVRGCFLLDMQC